MSIHESAVNDFDRASEGEKLFIEKASVEFCCIRKVRLGSPYPVWAGYRIGGTGVKNERLCVDGLIW